MRDTQRQPAAGLIGRLLAEPHRFEFFQAVRLLEQWLRKEEGAGGSGDARLRFRNRLSLAFPPSDIAAIAGDCRGEIRCDITPAVMGLLGSTGALPLHYTERIAAHEQREDDDGPRAFLDMFSQRSLAMFCQAWALYRPECMADSGGEERFLVLLRALAGREYGQAAGNGCLLAREAFARYAIQFASRTVSHDAMGGALSEYFGVPFKVVPLVAVWEHLPPQQQAQLGRAHCCLQGGVPLGERLYRCDTRARIRIGPLCRADYERFLRRGDGAAALQAMLGAYCTVGVTFEVQLLLRAGEAHGFGLPPAAPAALDMPAGGARLGIDAFLLEAPSACERGDARYLLYP